MELEGRTALITGSGAVGGLGFATARLFAAEGAGVVITGKDERRGAEAAAALGSGARFVLADLRSLEDVRRLAKEAGPIDILVNNAAALEGGPSLDQTPEEFESSYLVNVRAPFFLTAAAVPGMIERGGGVVVNVSSVAGFMATPGRAVYGSTKAALESLTKTWAVEFASSGVRVNAVRPGTMHSAKADLVSGGRFAEAGLNLPIKRVSTPDEIAQAVLFLASDRSRYMAGAVLPIDGGRTVI